MILTKPTEEVQDDSELTELREQLFDLTADLVSQRANEPFLRKLLGKPLGNWLDAFALYDEMEHRSPAIEQFHEIVEESLFVVWLDHPESTERGIYCTITLFAPELMWSNTVIYNRQWLLTHSGFQQNGAGH